MIYLSGSHSHTILAFYSPQAIDCLALLYVNAGAKGWVNPSRLYLFSQEDNQDFMSRGHWCKLKSAPI